MATVIRSPRIGGEAVTLAIRRQSESRPLPVHATAAAPSVDRTSEMQVPPATRDVIPSRAEHEQERLMSTLREMESTLQERERVLREQLAAERERVLKDAYAEGYKQGEAAGAEQFSEQLHALRELVHSLREGFSAGVSGVEDVVVGIAFEAVCKMIGAAMHDAEGVIAVVREVTSRVKDQEGLVIRVSPRHYDLLCRHWETLFKEGQGGKHELVADDRVAFGGCLVETSGGTLDGRLEIQLQQLRDTLVAASRMLPE